jgi:hypothetical protein
MTRQHIHSLRDSEKAVAPEENRLRLIVDARLLEVLEGGVGIVAPEFLELVDLVEGDGSCAELLLLGGHLDEPGQERAVLDQRGPLRRVPDNVL